MDNDYKDLKLEEYKMLREEMQNCTDRDNTLVTFMVTAVATILTFAVSSDLQVPFLFLISFCIIIPFSARLSHYKTNIARISAYIIVFLEDDLDIKYETRNINAKSPRSKSTLLLVSMRNYIGFGLGLISYLIYIAEYFAKIGINSFFDVIYIILPSILLVITFIIDRKIDSIPKQRKEWIVAWEELKKENKEK